MQDPLEDHYNTIAENNETSEVITITINDEPLEVVDKLKYLDMTLMKYGKSETEINI